jgi:transcription initiation factor IIE alpha subunit
MTDAGQMRLLEAERYYTKPALAQEHSDTSREAAALIEPKRPTLRARVLKAIKRYGALTDEEIQTETGLNPSTVRPRRIELVEMGLVRDSGRRRETRSGRRAVVWEAI